MSEAMRAFLGLCLFLIFVLFTTAVWLTDWTVQGKLAMSGLVLVCVTGVVWFHVGFGALKRLMADEDE